MNHSTRAHSLLSPSAAHRWMTCTPSAKLCENMPDTKSEAAAEGTLAHELCEAKIRTYILEDWTKRKLAAFITKLKKNELWQEEMQEHTQEYLDYVNKEALAYPETPFIDVESKLDLSNWITEPGASGTADCILIGNGLLTVIDFKYGKGVPVYAEHNPQMLIYALGAYSKYNFIMPITDIKCVIFQPRINNISEWSTSLDDLLAFGKEVTAKSEEALKGDGEFVPGEAQCRFCKARATCRARADLNIKLAGFTSKKPPLLSNEEIGEYLNQGEDVASWLSDLKDYALAECLNGREVKGYRAVEGRGSRSWTDADKAFETLIANDVPEEMLYERKQVTLAGIEKLIGKKRFGEIVGEFVEKKPGKPALVKESDKRKAISNIVSAEDAFKN